MTRRLTRTPLAISDLAEIVAYIAKENPHAAARMADKLDATSKLLAAQPRMGTPDPDRPGRRLHLSGNYLIQYRELPDGIEVLRYYDGRRDRRRL